MCWRGEYELEKEADSQELLKMGLVYVSGSDMVKGERKRPFVSLQSISKT